MSDNLTSPSERTLVVARRQRCKPPFIRFYFESPRHWYAELAGEVTEDIYDEIHPLLEEIARQRGMILTESLIETEEDAAR